MLRCQVLAIVAAASFAAAANAQDMFYSRAEQDASVFQNQVIVGETVNDTYFCIAGNGIGYGGIQQNDAFGKRVGIFSIWDQNGEKATLVAYNHSLDVKRAGRFGGEGTGVQFLFNFPWRNGRAYRWAFRAYLEPDGKHLRLSGFFLDPTRKTWRYAVTFRALTNGRLLRRPYVFNENYGGIWGDRRATYSNAWWCEAVSGAWDHLLGGSLVNLPHGPKDFGRADGSSKGFTLTSGPRVIHDQRDRDVVQYDPAGGEEPKVIPYQIRCGSPIAIENAGADALARVSRKQEYGAGYLREFEPDGYLVEFQPTTSENIEGAPPARVGKDFAYRMIGLVPGDEYHLTLHIWSPSAGRVLQRITVNGQIVFGGSFGDDLPDPNESRRTNHRVVARYHPTTLSVPVSADTSGSVLIRFTSIGEGNALVNAIELH